MTDKNFQFDDSGSLGSILSKRESAASAVLPDNRTNARPKSASSTSSSFQIVHHDDMNLSTPIKSNMVSGTRGEALSGGGDY
jgi:hypothetical protein